MPSKNKGGSRAQHAGVQKHSQPLWTPTSPTKQANAAAPPFLKQNGASKAAPSHPPTNDGTSDTGILSGINTGKTAGLALDTPATGPPVIDIMDTGIVKGPAATGPPIVDVVDTGIIKRTPDISPQGPFSISPAVQLPEPSTTSGAAGASPKLQQEPAAASTGPSTADADEEAAVPDLGLFLDEEVSSCLKAVFNYSTR